MEWPGNCLRDLRSAPCWNSWVRAALGIAVARNERVVRSADYDDQTLCEGDRVEIITAVSGG